MSGPLVLGSVGPLTQVAMEREPVRQSSESHRLTPEQVCETEWAFRFGTLSARMDQLCSAVDETLENIAQVQWDAPKVLERLKAARDAGKAATVIQ